MPPAPKALEMSDKLIDAQDLNPIEQAFAKYKALLRKAAERTLESQWQTISRIADLFPPAQCRNFFNSAGYAT